MNVEDFVEFECPNMNKLVMKEQKLMQSPKLKVSIHVRENSIKKAIEQYVSFSSATQIFCDYFSEHGHCKFNSCFCLYLKLQK